MGGRRIHSGTSGAAPQTRRPAPYSSRMWPFLLIAPLAATTTQAGRPPNPEAAQRWALLLMLLALLAVGLLVALAAAWVLRRGRRLRDAARDQKPTQVVDAWAEAGRRARGDLLAGEDPGATMGPPPPLEPPERPDPPAGLGPGIPGGDRP